MGGGNTAPERMELSPRQGAATTAYWVYVEEPQRRIGERNTAQTPVRSNGGVYSSFAAVRSWVNPSTIPQLRMYSAAARYSARVTRRARRPYASGWGVYWLISENSTSPGRNVRATQSMTRRLLSGYPGSTRWRMTTPRRSRPFSMT